MNGLALCSGVGGIDLGLKLAIPGYRTVCHVEREAFCAAVLVARMEDEALERAPIWDDVRTFDGRPWRGVVDIVTAGFPCQPHSVAGKRAGTADSRWLWDDIARIIAEVDAPLVFIENVPGLVTSGLDRVYADLLGMGFRVEAGLFSAAEVGAPHRRQRLFLLAHAERGGIGQSVRGESTSGEGLENRSGNVGDAAGTRRDARESSQGGKIWDESRRSESDRRIGTLGDAECARRETPSGGSDLDPGLQPFPPGPSHSGTWPMGLEPAIRRVADGDASRMDRLRALGNGVVPAVVATAWNCLAEKAGLA